MDVGAFRETPRLNCHGTRKSIRLRFKTGGSRTCGSRTAPTETQNRWAWAIRMMDVGAFRETPPVRTASGGIVIENGWHTQRFKTGGSRTGGSRTGGSRTARTETQNRWAWAIRMMDVGAFRETPRLNCHGTRKSIRLRFKTGGSRTGGSRTGGSRTAPTGNVKTSGAGNQDCECRGGSRTAPTRTAPVPELAET